MASGWARSGSIALVLGLVAWATPAWAFGSFAHGLIAERACDQLTPQHPWLVAHREAFVLGALAPDLVGPENGAAGRRAHQTATLRALWRAAVASGDRGARAFVLGWAVHLAADETFERAMMGPRLDALAGTLSADGRTPPRDLAPLLDFAVDAALVPVANGTLGAMYRSVAINTITPAGAPLRAMLGGVLGIDDAAYMGWARYTTALTAGGPDRYLAGQSRSASLEPWAASLRSAPARHALGDLRGLLTQAVTRGCLRAQDVLVDEETPPEQRAEVSRL